jgi:hypothetical protein
MEPEVIELALCESKHLVLRPNTLYKFIVIPTCEECKKLASVYE